MINKTVAHIFSFPEKYIFEDKQRPLSKLMIKTLEIACDRQKNNVPFGPKDIRGSVTLIKRGLIRNHVIELKGKYQLTWYVTQLGIDMLQAIDTKIKS